VKFSVSAGTRELVVNDWAARRRRHHAVSAAHMRAICAGAERLGRARWRWARRGRWAGTGACPYLVAGAALDVEDRASVAAAAYEPFTLARVAKAERAAAYRSGGHAAATDGTDYGPLTDKGILDLGELDRGVLGGLGHAFILRKCSVCRRPVR